MKIHDKFLLLTMLSIVTLFGLIGCSSEPEPVENLAEPEIAAAPREAPARDQQAARQGSEQQTLPGPTSSGLHRYVPDVEGQLESEGTGLMMIVDGSSAAAFKDSLSLISSDTSAEQYQSLERAIRYLHSYDPRFMGVDARMREGLNGMTGQEIIDLADQRTRERFGRKYVQE